MPLKLTPAFQGTIEFLKTVFNPPHSSVRELESDGVQNEEFAIEPGAHIACQISTTSWGKDFYLDLTLDVQDEPECHVPTTHYHAPMPVPVRAFVHEDVHLGKFSAADTDVIIHAFNEGAPLSAIAANVRTKPDSLLAHAISLDRRAHDEALTHSKYAYQPG